MAIYNRYIKLRKAIRYPDGTIEYIVPFEEKKGELISQENFESLEDCLYNYQYRWYTIPLNNEDSNTFICEGYAQYYKEVYQKSTDNEHWVDVEPKQERKGDLVKEFSEACGYVPLTEWRVVEFDLSNPDSYICEFFSLYKKEVEYISYDNGKTYEPSGNVRKGDLIEHYSETCGYGPAVDGQIIVTATTDSMNQEILLTPHAEYFYSIMLNNVNIKEPEDTLRFEYPIPNPGNTVLYYNTVNELDTCKDMFYDCEKLTKIDVRNFDSSKITNMQSMFRECTSLKTVDTTNFNTSNVTSMNMMFYGCSGLTSLDVTYFDTSNVTDFAQMFELCKNVTSLNVRYFNTSKAVYMRNMFSLCGSLTSLDVSNFNTSNSTEHSYMFYGCSGLTSLDVTNFDTSKSLGIDFMFGNCTNLENIDVSNFDTSNVKNMSGLFQNCISLRNINVTNFKTSNVISMRNMFNGCSGITTLNLSNFDTSNVENMQSMFSGCTSLTSLDLSNFSISEDLTYYGYMFDNCTSLNHIKCTQAFKDFCESKKTWINLTNFDSINWEIV